MFFGFGAQDKAASGSKLRPLFKVVLQPTNLCCSMIMLEKQGIEVQLDRLDRQEPHRGPRQGFSFKSKWLQCVSRFSVLFGKCKNLGG